MRKVWGRLTLAAVTAACMALGAVPAAVGAAAPPPTGCQPTACTAGTTVGLTNGSGVPIAGSAGLYAWGAAEEPDGSILVGDYWNFRIVHYNANGTEASPFVFTKSKQGFGNDTNQEPFGICVDDSGGPFQGYVYMTEGSLYNVVQYDPSGNWVTSWGTPTRSTPSNSITRPSASSAPTGWCTSPTSTAGRRARAWRCSTRRPTR